MCVIYNKNTNLFFLKFFLKGRYTLRILLAFWAFYIIRETWKDMLVYFLMNLGYRLQKNWFTRIYTLIQAYLYFIHIFRASVNIVFLVQRKTDTGAFVNFWLNNKLLFWTNLVYYLLTYSKSKSQSFDSFIYDIVIYIFKELS